jgi:poly-gamma-glutamate capsule biosynthesis protein CapA/YwtB (metallophosphatase superfamily)
MLSRMAEMTATVALAGDTMLGRRVGERLASDPTAPLVAPEVAEAIASCDAFVLNLECCISTRGRRFGDSRKSFFFRAPPVAAERLAKLGVGAVTLANNHALDFGPDALLDTLAHLQAVGIATVGAGVNEALAHTPCELPCGDLRLRLVGLADHPLDYAAGPERPGIAFVHLDSQLPRWTCEAVQAGPNVDAVLVTPHWGPNMIAEPVGRVSAAADALIAAGATVVAGHSAHVFHGVAGAVLYDLGDFLDDYAADPELRNDLGLLWLVELDARGLRRIRAVPLALDYCFTRLACTAEADWIARRLRALCEPFGTDVETSEGLINVWPQE